MTDARRNEVLAVITEIVRKELKNPDVVLSENSTAKEVVGWDSLAHIGIILGVEKKFGLRLKASQVAGLHRVGELIDLVLA